MSRCVLLGYPPWETVTVDPDHIAAACRPAEIAIRNRALETTLRAKRAETTAQLMLERGGL